MLDVLRQSIETCALFVRPDGDYAGNLGSRNTQHFYAHGFEVLADAAPLAGALAEHLLKGLAAGRGVPPEIMSDRYVFYRVPELLEAHLDYSPRAEPRPTLPFQQPDFRRWLPNAKIFATNCGPYYVIANAAKGGVVKVFDRERGIPLLADSGVVGRSNDGRVVTSQWVDEDYQVSVRADGFSVMGHLHVVPSNKVFSMAKFIIFRLVLFFLGWSASFCHFLKGKIRSALILKSGTVPVSFTRQIAVSQNHIIIDDELTIERSFKFAQLSFGGERFLRFVPQSRFFQKYELEESGTESNDEALKLLTERKRVHVRTTLNNSERVCQIIMGGNE